MEEAEEQQQMQQHGKEELQQLQQVKMENTNPWINHPEELQIAILKRLPWMDKLRLRRVCTVWNTLLRDPQILRSSRPPEGSTPPFCCFNPHDQGGEFQIYSTLGESWQTFASAPNFKVIAAAAGLLLMEGVVEGRRTLILLNPLNRTQRQLLLPVDLVDVAQSYVFEMTVDKVTDQIRILTGVWHVWDDQNVRNPHHRHWHGWKFYVYYVASNSWKVVADVALRDEGYTITEVADQVPSVTLVGNDLYVLSAFHGTSHRLYIVKPTHQPGAECIRLGLEQNLVRGGGSALPFSSSYVESKLFESEGRLLLLLRQRFRIGHADDFVNNFWQVSLLEFDFSTSDWKIALHLRGELARSRSYVSLNAGGGFLCMHNQEYTGICNIGSDTWARLPAPWATTNIRFPRTTEIFLFEPRLDIVL